MSANENPLDRFREATGQRTGAARTRGKPPRPPIPTRQKVIVASALLWFAVTLFWHRGGLGLTGHFVSAGLGLLTFAWLFLPGFSDRPDGTPRAQLGRLLRFPVFWFGLAAIGYGVLQTLNPAYGLFLLSSGGGKMVPLPHIEWLPAGVRVPADYTNSPRAGLLQLGLPWLMVCTLVAGLRSRRVVDGLLIGALGIVTAWTFMALGYYYTGEEDLYGLIPMGVNNVPPFWGSLKNPNHGAVIQLLGLLLSLGLAGRAFRRSLQTHGRIGGVQLFYFALAVFFSLATLQSLSRGAILILGLIWIAAVLGGGWMAYQQRSFKVLGLVGGFFVLLVIGGTVWAVVNLRGGASENELVQTLGIPVDQTEDEYRIEGAGSLSRRSMLNRVSWRLLDISPVYGHGVGGWSYVYRRSVDPVAERALLISHYRWVYNDEGKRARNQDGQFFKIPIPMHWEHAHNDWLQYLVEFGAVGMVPVLALVLWIPGVLFVSARRTGFLGWTALGAAVVVGLVSAYEFPTRTPALGLLFALLLAGGFVERQLRTGGKRKPTEEADQLE